MAGTLNYRFLVRGGTAAALSSLNEIPKARELIVETDTQKLKIGDGATTYVFLPYISTGGGGAAGGAYATDKSYLWSVKTHKGSHDPTDSNSFFERRIRGRGVVVDIDCRSVGQTFPWVAYCCDAESGEIISATNLALTYLGGICHEDIGFRYFYVAGTGSSSTSQSVRKFDMHDMASGPSALPVGTAYVASSYTVTSSMPFTGIAKIGNRIYAAQAGSGGTTQIHVLDADTLSLITAWSYTTSTLMPERLVTNGTVLWALCIATSSTAQRACAINLTTGATSSDFALNAIAAYDAVIVDVGINFGDMEIWVAHQALTPNPPQLIAYRTVNGFATIIENGLSSSNNYGSNISKVSLVRDGLLLSYGQVGVVKVYELETFTEVQVSDVDDFTHISDVSAGFIVSPTIREIDALLDHSGSPDLDGSYLPIFEDATGETKRKSLSGLKTALGIPAALTTKGDLLGYSTVPARVAVGTNGKVLTADSAAASGVSWQPPGGSSSADAPALINDLVFWFQADRIKASAGTVIPMLQNSTPWYTGYNAGKSGVGAKISAAQLNSLNVATFPGNTDGRYGLSGTVSLSKCTIFIVVKPASFAAGSTILSGVTNSFELRIDQTTGKLEILKTFVASIATDTTGLTVSTWAQANVTYNSSTGAYAFRRGRSASSSGTSTTSITDSAYSIGVNQPSSTLDLNADLAELIVYTRVLTSTEITDVENYLYAKWGV